MCFKGSYVDSLDRAVTTPGRCEMCIDYRSKVKAGTREGLRTKGLGLLQADVVTKGPSTQYLRTLVPKAIKGMVFGTRVLKYSVLGFSGCFMDPNEHPAALYLFYVLTYDVILLCNIYVDN